jgi:hypothetical protein
MNNYIGFMVSGAYDYCFFEELMMNESSTDFYVFKARNREDAKLKLFEKLYPEFDENDILNNAYSRLLHSTCELDDDELKEELQGYGEQDYDLLSEIVNTWVRRDESEWDCFKELRIFELSDKTIRTLVYDHMNDYILICEAKGL